MRDDFCRFIEVQILESNISIVFLFDGLITSYEYPVEVEASVVLASVVTARISPHL